MQRYIHIGKLYGALHRKTQAFMREAFNGMDVPFADAVVLICVYEHPGWTQDEIASDLSIDPAAIARSLKRLEGLDLVFREADPNNQRKKCAFPTKKALAYQRHFDSSVRYWNNLTFEGLTEEEIDTLYSILYKMKETSSKLDVSQAVAEWRERYAADVVPNDLQD